MNIDPGRIEFEPLVRVEEGLWLSPSADLPLPRVARAVYSGFVLRFPYGLLEGIRLMIDPPHYHQGNDADRKPTGEEDTGVLPIYFLRGELSTPRGVIGECQRCRKREKLKKGDNQLRINAIDDEHDFLALTESSVRIKFKTTCSSCHQGSGAFSLKLWIVDQHGSVIAQGEHDLDKVIANAAKRRRCQKTAATQGEPPKKRRRTKAASPQPPPSGPTASAPTSPASAAGRLQFRPIMPAPDLRAFQPLPGAPWLPLGQLPPPTVAQAHADPTQSPVPSCGGTSSPAPSPSPSPVDSCVDVSPIPIELEGFSNRGLSNSPETAKACANESLEDEYNDLGPNLLDFGSDIIVEMLEGFEKENAQKC